MKVRRELGGENGDTARVYRLTDQKEPWKVIIEKQEKGIRMG